MKSLNGITVLVPCILLALQMSPGHAWKGLQQSPQPSPTRREWPTLDGHQYSVTVPSAPNRAKRTRKKKSVSKYSVGGSLKSSLHSDDGDFKRHGRACSIYVWDAPSALLYKWCHHLLKGCIYEGRGGRKFVRIEPGSILQLLYPPSRYSPDRCVICGGKFHDHLVLWWGKHLYTPFDRFLDRTYAAGKILDPRQSPLPNKRTQRPPRRYRKFYASGKRNHASEPTKVFAFHRKYVLDADTLVERRGLERKVWTKKLQNELIKLQKSSSASLEMRALPDSKVVYVVPAAEPPAESGTRTKNGQQVPSATLQIVRSIVLSAVNNLIRIQETQNNSIRQNAPTF